MLPGATQRGNEPIPERPTAPREGALESVGDPAASVSSHWPLLGRGVLG